MQGKYYTVKEFAEKKGVLRQTVYKWIKKGHLQASEEKTGPFRHLLIPKKAADEFLPPRSGRPKKNR